MPHTLTPTVKGADGAHAREAFRFSVHALGNEGIPGRKTKDQCVFRGSLVDRAVLPALGTCFGPVK